MIQRPKAIGGVDDSPSKRTSPCVRNCCLDENDICLGCGRALEEITGWNAASETEKQNIRERSQQRLLSRSTQGSFDDEDRGK